MSAIERVRRARRVLIATIAGKAALLAAAAGIGGLGVLALLDWLAPLPLDLRAAALPVAVAGALVVAGFILRRGRNARGLDRVALFLEERVPQLEYALVTALDAADSPGAAELERLVERYPPDAALRKAALRAAAGSLGALLLATAFLAVLPGAARERVLAARPGDVLLRPARAVAPGSRLAPLVATVTPPAYTRSRIENLDDPASVRALVGSRVLLRGRGAARGVDSLAAAIGSGPLGVRVAGDTWSVALAMPDHPAVIRLTDRGYDRLVTLEPVPDRPPAVTLVSPARDTTYRVPRGALSLEGRAEDDIGLARAEFEVMHTSGSGERFEVRRLTLASVSPGGNRSATIRSGLLLDTMRLGPGDVLHIRVTALDENDVTGPGEGASDTRTIRIADPSIRDTVPMVAAAMPALDTTMLSQRTLILRAESLLVRRTSMPPASFDEQVRVIGGLQGQLRSRVEQVIDDLETITDVGFMGRTPTSSILREAVSAMRQAERQLALPTLPAALPHMYRALQALERARNADRLYLRGIFPKLVVDLDKVRLKGTETYKVGERTPRPPLPDPRRTLRERLDRALALVQRNPGLAIDSLTMIRVEALTQAPDAATALAGAIDALRHGRDALPTGLAARRLLLRETEAAAVLPEWRRP